MNKKEWWKEIYGLDEKPERVYIVGSDIYPIINPINDSVKCPKCGEEMSFDWEIDCDPDSLHYFVKHKECGITARLYPISFYLEIERGETEE